MKNLRHTLLLVVSIVFFIGCSKKKSDPSPSNNDNKNPTSTASAYLVFFDGTSAVKIEAGVDGVYNGAISSGSNSYYTTGGNFLKFPAFKGDVLYGANFGGFPSGSDAYDDYSVGANSFGSEATGTKGFIISYTDVNGILWSTSKGVGTQTNSAINITSKSAYSPLAQYYVLEGTFNCTMYNSENSNSKILTNGKFKSIFAYE